MGKISSYIIGRDPGADIIVNDPSVSRRHAELTIAADGRYFLTDCASSRGTFIANGGQWERIQQTFVAEATVVLLGAVKMTTADLIRMIAMSNKDVIMGHLNGGAHGFEEGSPDRGLPVGKVIRNSSGEIVAATDKRS